MGSKPRRSYVRKVVNPAWDVYIMGYHDNMGMKCMICGHEWVAGPDNCPKCPREVSGDEDRGISLCVNSTPENPRGHSWYRWRGTAGDTFEPGKTYRYEAKCQMMGCNAIRYCNELVIAGEHYGELDSNGDDVTSQESVLPPHCSGCRNRSVWVRCTQFAGDHYFCIPCAEKEEDFGKDDPSYFFWKRLHPDA